MLWISSSCSNKVSLKFRVKDYSQIFKASSLLFWTVWISILTEQVFQILWLAKVTQVYRSSKTIKASINKLFRFWPINSKWCQVFWIKTRNLYKMDLLAKIQLHRFPHSTFNKTYKICKIFKIWRTVWTFLSQVDQLSPQVMPVQLSQSGSALTSRMKSLKTYSFSNKNTTWRKTIVSI